MKLSTLVLAAASLAALSATASLAQDKPMVAQSPVTGKPVVMVPMNANAKDMFMASWVYRNLDDREVKRFRAQGFQDATIKGAANIAMRVGVPVDYVLRQVREVGTPLATIATMYNVPTNVVNADVPGYGLESMAITAPMGGSMNNGSMRSGSMGSGTTMSPSTTPANP